MGECHIELSDSLNNLALLQKNLGNYADARQLYETTLKIKREALGENDLETIEIYNNLGVLLYNQGDMSGARKIYE